MRVTLRMRKGSWMKRPMIKHGKTTISLKGPRGGSGGAS
jgi:hypothetical protein